MTGSDSGAMSTESERALAELDGVDAKDADHIRSQINELPF